MRARIIDATGDAVQTTSRLGWVRMDGGGGKRALEPLAEGIAR